MPALSRLQSVIGFFAGLTSVVGALYSGVRYLTTPQSGELAAVVREAGTSRPVRDATIEVLTRDDALVTTLAPSADGWARYPLNAGGYVLRVRHARLGAAPRAVEVRGGETAEVRFDLAPVVTSARRSRRPSGTVSRFLGRLGL